MEYEFTALQNDQIKVLASRMRFVGVFMIVVGIMVALMGLLSLITGLRAIPVFLTDLVGAAVYLLIGTWTFNASASFKNIVQTETRDIEHLMNALGALKNLYTFQYIVLLIVLILITIGVVFAFFTFGIAALHRF